MTSFIKMFTNYMKCLFLMLMWLNSTRAGLAVRKFVYQVDLSEHCRRRVMPSVFLGRHVVEANSQILHFSQLDVPYSCYISIRTESGSNIILVTQVSAVKRKAFACNEDENQVLVYEFGETFGGYWGPIPDSVLTESSPPSSPAVYTLATRKQTTTTPFYEEYYDEDTTTIITTTEPTTVSGKKKEGDFIRIEVPLMNVSGHYVTSDTMPERAFEFHENFDILYDVARKPGEQYATSMMPVAQFAMQPVTDERRAGGDDGNLTDSGAGAPAQKDDGPRFQLDYDIADFTPDPRLTFSYAMGRTGKVRNFLTKKGPHFTTKSPFEEENIEIYLNETIDSTTVNQETVMIDKTSKKADWDEIEQLLKSLTNKTGYTDKIDVQELASKNVSELLQRISNIDHNSSAYLALNWSMFDNMKTTNFDNTKTTAAEVITKSTTPIMMIEDLLSFTEESSFETSTSSESMTVNKEITNIYAKHRTTNSSKSTIVTTQSLNRSSSMEVLPTTLSMDEDIHTPEFEKSRSTDDDSYITVIDEEMITTPTIEYSSKELKVTQTENTMTQKTVTNTENEVKMTTIEELDELLDRRAFNYIPYDKDGVSVPPNIDVTSKKLTKVTTVNNTTVLHVTKNSKKSNKNRQTPLIGVMVDHKSFENVVKAAPVMADILATNGPRNTINQNPFQRKKRATKSLREKRYVSVIPIEDARPHHLTQGPVKGTTHEALYHFNDKQDFEQLVELQDDGVYGHMVLRYMRRYVGAVLFNLCKEHAEFNVYLFNASRIVLAINNFTLKRMTVVATPARTMVNPGGHCPDLYLECQIKGARVCVDTVTACDGVPNCGAWEIYDEDRLYCGADKGFQQHVYLTALTFLAVMLTSSYTVYYWLRRCVPKVSDAFFIYTDGTENILYLDSIMRSNNDADNFSKMMPSFYYDVDLDMARMKKKEPTIQKIIRCFRNCFRKKNRYRDSRAVIAPTDSFLSRQMKMYSFSELEGKKINPNVSEIGVQTGDSLEIKTTSEDEDASMKYGRLKRLRENSLLPYQMGAMTAKCEMEPMCSMMRKNKGRFSDAHETSAGLLMSIMEEGSHHTTEDSELNIMKFMKTVRSGSIQRGVPPRLHDQGRVSILPAVDETELRSTMLDHILHEAKTENRSQRLHSSASSFTQTEPVAGPSGQVSKRLRFVEQQPAEQEHDEEDHEHGKDVPRRFWGVGKPKATAKKKTTLPFLSPR